MKLDELKAQIYDDLDRRQDITTHVANAISSAIQFYEVDKWWFLEEITAITAVTSSAVYSIPANLLDYDDMLITIAGQKQPLRRVHYTELNQKDTGNFTGVPTEWTYYQDQIRLYPIPNASYVLTLSYHKSLPEMTTSSSNAWTTVAKDLIRFRAVGEVRDMISKGDPKSREYANRREAQEYQRLLQKNCMRQSTGRVKKTEW